MNTNKKLNMTMLCDFYELTMGNGYFKAGYKDRITHFDLFFRSVPDKGGDMPLRLGWSRSSSTSRTSTLSPRISSIFGAGKLFDEGFLDYLGEL